jgi:signal transduction histidine kinase
MAAGVLAATLGLVAELASTPWDHVGVWLPDLLAGWALITCGVVAALTTPRQWTARALVAAGALWFAANAGTAVPGAAGDALDALTYGHRGLVFTGLLLLGPRPVAWLVSGAALASTLVIPWMTEPGPMLAWAGLVLLVGCLLTWTSRTPGRVTATFGYVALAGTVAAVAAIATYGAPDVAGDLATSTYQGGMTLTAGAALLAALAHRARSATVADAVVRLAAGPDGTLRGQLADALRDPGLDVAFAAADGWIDELGRPRDGLVKTSGRALVVVEVEGGVVAVISCRDDIATARHVVASIEAATRLSARQAGLRAALRAEADRLRDSRRRLLLVEDEARRELAVRLRAGIDEPLATLETAADTLSAQPALGSATTRLRERQRTVRAELVRLASGLGPGALETGDLASSLGLLTAGLSLDVACAVTDVTLPRDLGTTVYLLCAEAVANVDKHARATSLDLRVEVEGGQLVVTVADDGVGGARLDDGTGLRGLAQRLAALGGTLEVVSPPGHGTRVVGRLDL